MDKEFVQSFFPFVTAYVSSSERAPAIIFHAWNFIFPDQSHCDQHYHDKSSLLQIQRPCLAMAAVLGAYIGIRYGRGITHLNQKHDDLLVAVVNDSWSKSSTFFGCMNISALVHHCIFPNNASWFLDCAFTGASSLNLFTTSILLWILYGLEFSERFQKIMENKTLESIKQYIRMLERATKVVVAIMIHTAMVVMGGRDSEVEVSLAAASNAVEMFYFVPLVMAICVLFPITLIGALCQNNTASYRGPLVALLGGALIAVAPLLGQPICRFVSDYMPGVNDSSLLYDCYHLPTLAFLGCDISFYGLGVWIRDLTAKKGLSL